MKGLFLNHMDRKEEAHELVRKGLSNDVKGSHQGSYKGSHICWHVYGLLHRSDKNYGQALKCYTHALKIDKDSQLQLLSLKPNNQKYWIGLAISYHLQKNHETAENVLTTYEGTLKEKPTPLDFEHGEMLMYRNLIIEESGDIQRALENLESIKDKVCDKRSWKEKKAQFLLNLEKYQEAEQAYRELIDLNPDCYEYFEGLHKSQKINTRELNEEQQVEFLKTYKELATKYSRSNAIKRFPLQYTAGENFKKAVDEYLQSALRKGVPSLFVNVKKLYDDPEKATIIESLVEGYLESLKKYETFTYNGTEVDLKEPPTAYLWTLYFLAQHYDYKRDTIKALQLINEAIEHTPTMVELYMTKGRILKHGGDVCEAMKAMNEGRELDLQDRFINSKCTKYMLRNGQITEAEKTIGLFTRGDAPDPITDLIDMQCMWFELEEGECYLRQNKFGRSLKRFHQIEKHFADITDDQFDFHSYCLRKVTLRAYLSMLRLEDRLRSHPYYFRAAQNAIKIYLTLYDNPSVTAVSEDDSNFANMTEGEIKKAKSKAKKAAAKAQQEAESKKAQQEEQAKKKVSEKPRDEDPEGDKFVKTTDPLGEAFKFYQPLQELSPKRIETHLLGFEIYLRKKRYLLALRSLIQAHSINSNNSTLHQDIIRFEKAVASDTSINPIVAKVVAEQLSIIHSQNIPLPDFNNEFLGRNKGSIPHLLVAAESLLLIDPSYKQEAEDLLLKIIDNEEYAGTRTLPICINVYESIKKTFNSRAEQFRLKCKDWFPIATYFRETN
ncbi:12419_t:CDS:10 [Ambispora gerdemannii]|uniref:12419_t:CDS:1 n=1 Tax=Ambispora gerdemannii TaxID=144530 RepID=A0A9N9BYC0_9GLOM|nr:12419_t:CDS:10 [Ambispora gerdemannii]